MSIAPRYDQYYDAWDTEFTCEVPLGEATTTVRFFHAFKKGVDRVFVDHPLFLERVWGLTKQKLYGPKWGKDWEDNQLRFAMFCRYPPLNKELSGNTCTCIHARMHTCTHADMRTCAHAHVFMYTHTYTPTHVHTYTHTYTCMHTRARAHTHTHTPCGRAAMAGVERLPLGGAPYGTKVMLVANDWQVCVCVRVCVRVFVCVFVCVCHRALGFGFKV